MENVNEEVLRGRLTELVKQRNDEERRRVRDLIDAENEKFPCLEEFDVESKFVKALDGITNEFCSDIIYLRINHDVPVEALTALFEYRFKFPRKSWEVKPLIDTDGKDEDNIFVSDESAFSMNFHEYDTVVEHLTDLLEVLGKVARRIDSSLKDRIVRLMGYGRMLAHYRGNFPHAEAAEIAKEIEGCIEGMRSELELMDPMELIGIKPPPPKHSNADFDLDEEFDASQYQDGDDPDAATDEAREFALEKYKKDFADLLPKGTVYKNEEGPVERLCKKIKALADKMDAAQPVIDDSWSPLDYSVLAKVLQIDFDLTYEAFENVEDDDFGVKLTHDTCWEETNESRQKKLIVEDLKRLITSAAIIAKNIQSSTYEDWARMLFLLEKSNGYFHGWFNEGEAIARRDAGEFVSLLRRARERIWSDITIAGNVKPVVRMKNTAIHIGKYASSFVSLCDPGKGVIVISDKEYRISSKAKKPWEYLSALVSTNDEKGYVELPSHWDSNFKATYGSSKELDPRKDINIVRWFIFTEHGKKGRDNTHRFRLMPKPNEEKIKSLMRGLKDLTA